MRQFVRKLELGTGKENLIGVEKSLGTEIEKESLGTGKDESMGTGKENFIGVGVGVGIAIDQTNWKSTPIPIPTPTPMESLGTGKENRNWRLRNWKKCWGQGKRVCGCGSVWVCDGERRKS
jgi:hypothetical protein